MEKLKILIVDDEVRIRDELDKFLSAAGHTVFQAERPSQAFKILDMYEPDIVILDIRLPETDGLTVLEKMKQSWPDMEIIIITGHGDMDSAIRAIRFGASDFFTKPFRLAEIQGAIKRTRRFLELNRRLKTVELNYSMLSKKLYGKHKIIAESPGMKKVVDMMTRVAGADDTTVLITGESGTGKELVAQGIHHLSARKNAHFYSVNVAAVPGNLFESEFFGHEKGAFTGASADKKGWFEIAQNSTLFMDEICETALELQVKLLRTLEERKITRLGSHKDIPVDVRMIAATNRDIEDMVSKKKFRADLYHRLNTFRIHIPPLRERREDMPRLLENFIRFYASKMNRPIDAMEEKAVERLMEYAFPGNVRELKNMTERAVILCDGNRLLLKHFPAILPDAQEHLQSNAGSEIFDLEIAEKNLVVRALKKASGNKTKTSQLLNISRQALDRRIERFGLSDRLSGA